MPELNKILFYLSLPFRPRYWLMNYKYSEAWDERLRSLMQTHDFRYYDAYTAYLGDTEIWVKNHPYASFNPHPIRVRPSRYTIYRARKKYEQDVLAHT